MYVTLCIIFFNNSKRFPSLPESVCHPASLLDQWATANKLNMFSNYPYAKK